MNLTRSEGISDICGDDESETKIVVDGRKTKTEKTGTVKVRHEILYAKSLRISKQRFFRLYSYADCIDTRDGHKNAVTPTTRFPNATKWAVQLSTSWLLSSQKQTKMRNGHNFVCCCTIVEFSKERFNLKWHPRARQ